MNFIYTITGAIKLPAVRSASFLLYVDVIIYNYFHFSIKNTKLFSSFIFVPTLLFCPPIPCVRENRVYLCRQCVYTVAIFYRRRRTSKESSDSVTRAHLCCFFANISNDVYTIFPSFLVVVLANLYLLDLLI
jgi:hypothetical protein